MAYNNDLVWKDIADLAGVSSKTLINAILHGKENYEKWISFRAGRSEQDIATALGVPLAQVQDAASCFQACLEIHAFATNGASPQQGDRFFGLRKFS